MIYGQPVTLGVGSKTTIGVSYNADGTQNLIIKDDGSVIEIPDPNPVLLWTNASPTSAFAGQTVSVESGYDAYLIETNYITTPETYNGVNITYVPVGEARALCVPLTISPSVNVETIARRQVTANSGSLVIGTPLSEDGRNLTTLCIPTRIWGVKFTL